MTQDNISSANPEAEEQKQPEKNIPKKPDIYKMHVSFENIYFIEAGSKEEARELLRDYKFGDLITEYSSTLLEVIPHEKAEELRDKITILGISGDADGTADKA